MKSNTQTDSIFQNSGLTALSLEDIQGINAGSEVSDMIWFGIGAVAKSIYNFVVASHDAQKAGPIRPSEYR